MIENSRRGSGKMRDANERYQEALGKLSELDDELHLIAESDARYARYAENFLTALQEAGYDV